MKACKKLLPKHSHILFQNTHFTLLSTNSNTCQKSCVSSAAQKPKKNTQFEANFSDRHASKYEVKYLNKTEVLQEAAPCTNTCTYMYVCKALPAVALLLQLFRLHKVFSQSSANDQVLCTLCIYLTTHCTLLAYIRVNVCLSGHCWSVVLSADICCHLLHVFCCTQVSSNISC